MDKPSLIALAAELRDTARGQLAAGETWAPADILPGDADALAEELGREPTAAEIAIFWETYSASGTLHDEIRAAVGVAAGDGEQAATARALGMTRRAYHEALGREIVPSRGLLRAILEQGCTVILQVRDGEIVTQIEPAPEAGATRITSETKPAGAPQCFETTLYADGEEFWGVTWFRMTGSPTPDVAGALQDYLGRSPTEDELYTLHRDGKITV